LAKRLKLHVYMHATVANYHDSTTKEVSKSDDFSDAKKQAVLRRGGQLIPNRNEMKMKM